MLVAAVAGPYTSRPVDHLRADQVERLRQALYAAKKSLLDGAAKRLGDVQGPGRDGVGRDTGDRQDAAADEALRITEAQLAGHERQKLADIEAALERLETGDYGICEDSGDEIPFARLWQVPTARRTVEAQELYEAEQGRRDERDGDSPY